MGQVVDYVRKQAGITAPKSGKITCFLIYTVMLTYIICWYLDKYSGALHIAEYYLWLISNYETLFG